MVKDLTKALPDFSKDAYWKKRMIEKISQTLRATREALDNEVGQNAIHINFRGMDKEAFLAARQKIYGGMTDLIQAVVPELKKEDKKPIKSKNPKIITAKK